MHLKLTKDQQIPARYQVPGDGVRARGGGRADARVHATLTNMNAPVGECEVVVLRGVVGPDERHRRALAPRRHLLLEREGLGFQPVDVLRDELDEHRLRCAPGPVRAMHRWCEGRGRGKWVK